MASAPAAAQTVTISASGNCGGTPANCGTPANRNGDRDTTWPGLQVDEGDTISFSVTNSVGHPSYPNPAVSAVNMSRSGTAFNSADLNSTELSPFSASTIAAPSLNPGSTRTAVYRYSVVNDSVSENDETVTFTLTSMNAADASGYTIGTPSSATVTIRGTDSAPSFGSGSVSARTFTAGVPVTEFQVPAATGGNGTITYAATGLPAGLRFDATGTDTPGCPGTEAREVCGTPTTPTSGAQTVTITFTHGVPQVP